MALNGKTNDSDTAAQEIATILEQAGIFIGVEIRDRSIHLDGEVESIENRDAALDIARAIADPLGLPIQDNLEIMTFAPDDAWPEATVSSGGFAYTEQAGSGELEPDFSKSPGTIDPDLADEGVPFFPPTDPVVAPSNDDQELEIVGGFQTTAMDSDPADARQGPPGDVQLEDMIRRELREDALTIDLDIAVEVREGVARLTGEVETLDDAENAEAVAARIEGVQAVREDLLVRSIAQGNDNR